MQEYNIVWEMEYCEVLCGKGNGTDPICSTISRALVMMFAPVQHTMPAISIEYQRALCVED